MQRFIKYNLLIVWHLIFGDTAGLPKIGKQFFGNRLYLPLNQTVQILNPRENRIWTVRFRGRYRRFSKKKCFSIFGKQAVSPKIGCLSINKLYYFIL